MEKTRYDEILPSDVQDWKAKYGANSLTEATITTQDGEYKFILRKPGRAVLEAVASIGDKEPSSAANKILIANCVLGGDTYVFEHDGAVYLAVLEQVSKLMSNAKAAVKKL